MSVQPDPESWGIAPGHHHVHGHWVPADPAGVHAALAAMGADDWAPRPTATWVISRNWGLHVPFPATLRWEDGGSARVSGHVPREELPLGYHWLHPDDGADPVRLIVSPGVCPLPRRTWGWAVQLYAARSRASWGMGDLGDLRRIAGWSKSGPGGGMVLINPLHGVAPTEGQQPSPYYPATRRWWNPIYLRIEDVPGAASLPGLDDLVATGRALNDGARIDRAAVWKLKRQALEELWKGHADVRFDAWAGERGASLESWATWAALVDAHGGDWRAWPEPYRDPRSPAVAAFRRDHDDKVRFHMWLQWLVWLQLQDVAAAGPAIVSDMAIGADPAGADAWEWQHVVAPGVTVGAPPDEFSPGGQDWGLPPFDPWRLRAAHYEPFVDIVRSAMAVGGGVRIDHVAGLFRLFWVPEGTGPTTGVYVRYPWEDLLNIVALEADRAGAFVVGEDLGTIEPETRDALAARHVLSYRLLWFEARPPAEWPELALGAVTTHDLPTVGGVWTGADAEARRSLGVPVDEQADAGLRDRLVHAVGADDTDNMAVSDVARRAYEALATAPSLLVSATLDDALEVTERPNQPGTVDEWPNWSIPLPLPLEEIELDKRVRAVAHTLASRKA